MNNDKNNNDSISKVADERNVVVVVDRTQEPNISDEQKSKSDVSSQVNSQINLVTKENPSIKQQEQSDQSTKVNNKPNSDSSVTSDLANDSSSSSSSKNSSFDSSNISSDLIILNQSTDSSISNLSNSLNSQSSPTKMVPPTVILNSTPKVLGKPADHVQVEPPSTDRLPKQQEQLDESDALAKRPEAASPDIDRSPAKKIETTSPGDELTNAPPTGTDANKDSIKDDKELNKQTKDDSSKRISFFPSLKPSLPKSNSAEKIAKLKSNISSVSTNGSNLINKTITTISNNLTNITIKNRNRADAKKQQANDDKKKQEVDGKATAAKQDKKFSLNILNSSGSANSSCNSTVRKSSVRERTCQQTIDEERIMNDSHIEDYGSLNCDHEPGLSPFFVVVIENSFKKKKTFH